MNLGSIWTHLDNDDKKIIISAIDYYGTHHLKSYLNKFVGGMHNSPKLAFLKLRPVLAALKFYTGNWQGLHDKERIAKMIYLLEKAVWTEYCNRKLP